MNLTSRGLAVAFLSFSLSAIVLAQAPVLDVKMGLWEISSVTRIAGQMPGMDTSKMTPQEKAQMEAAMKSMMGTDHPIVSKTCVTREKFDKSNFLMEDSKGMTCKQTTTTNTHTALEAHVVCAGAHSMTIQMHVDALSPTSFKGTMKSSTTENGKTLTADATMTGKWLAAECGDVK